jgi:hypothetical protein
MDLEQFANFPTRIPPDLFLCHPDNKQFVEGKSHRVRFSDEAWIWRYPSLAAILNFAVVGLLMLIVGVAARSLWSSQPPVFWVTCALALFGFTLLIAWSSTERNIFRRHLIREGRLLRGEVVECRSTWTLGGDGPDYYDISLEYAFSDPAGQRMREHTSFTRGAKWAAPKPGAPVALLYADNLGHRLL